MKHMGKVILLESENCFLISLRYIKYTFLFKMTLLHLASFKFTIRDDLSVVVRNGAWIPDTVRYRKAS